MVKLAKSPAVRRILAAVGTVMALVLAGGANWKP